MKSVFRYAPAKQNMEGEKARPERNFPKRMIRWYCNEVKQGVSGLKREGFRFLCDKLP